MISIALPIQSLDPLEQQYSGFLAYGIFSRPRFSLG